MRQERIHNLALSIDRDDRSIALAELLQSFRRLPDEERACMDLVKLANDADYKIRRKAMLGLRDLVPYISSISCIKYIEQYLNDYDKDPFLCYEASSIKHILKGESKRSSEDFIRWRMKSSSGHEKGEKAFSDIKSYISTAPNAYEAWRELVNAIKEHDNSYWHDDLRILAPCLPYGFPKVAAYRLAWEDIKMLAKSNAVFMRREAASAIVSGFPNIYDRAEAWDQLIRLIYDEDGIVRWISSSSLGSIYCFAPSV